MAQVKKQIKSSIKYSPFHTGILLGLFFEPQDVTCSSETSIDYQLTALRYIPEPPL
jgi:hypothetical protein